MSKFVFILLLIMPDGQTKMKTDLVLQCPPKAGVEHIMNDMKAQGEILDWGAACVQFKMKDNRT
jgi:hypothetical protein